MESRRRLFPTPSESFMKILKPSTVHFVHHSTPKIRRLDADLSYCSNMGFRFLTLPLPSAPQVFAFGFFYKLVGLSILGRPDSTPSFIARRTPSSPFEDKSSSSLELSSSLSPEFPSSSTAESPVATGMNVHQDLFSRSSD